MKPKMGIGDKGKTYFMGKKIWKDDIYINFEGKIDELSCFIGLTISKNKFDDINNLLEKIQGHLFILGANVAGILGKKNKISRDHVKFIEEQIELYNKELEVLSKFIFPRGELSSLLHICRVTCREAERVAVSLKRKRKINENIIPYLNRLSDLFFTLARVVNKRFNIEEKKW